MTNQFLKYSWISKSFYFLFCVLACQGMYGQTSPAKKDKKPAKGIIYGGVGSHRIWYTPANIHVIRGSSPSFDFTLSKVKGQDDGGLKFKTSPQYSYELGYYFTNKKFGLEYHFDHIKYYAIQNQVVRMKGSINGTNYDKDTALTPGFFMLEHTDGGNYAMLNFVKWIPWPGKKKFISPQWMFKAGMGVVFPKTNSTILGNYRDDKYHISGHVIGVEAGMRLHIGKYFFATGSFKGAYANYSHFLISGGYGKHKWVSGQFNYLVGGQIPL